MKRVTRNEVDFSEIFEYASKEFGMHWNECNTLFFNTVLDYNRHNDFMLEEVMEDLKPEDAEYQQAITIIRGFMQHHNLQTMRVYN